MLTNIFRISQLNVIATPRTARYTLYQYHWLVTKAKAVPAGRMYVCVYYIYIYVCVCVCVCV